MKQDAGRYRIARIKSRGVEENEIGRRLTIVKRLNGRSEADAISKWLGKEAEGANSPP